MVLHMSKEMWIAAWEDIYTKLTEAGCPEDIARELADEKASGVVSERLADHADYLRKRAKEEA